MLRSVRIVMPLRSCPIAGGRERGSTRSAESWIEVPASKPVDARQQRRGP